MSSKLNFVLFVIALVALALLADMAQAHVIAAQDAIDSLPAFRR